MSCPARRPGSRLPRPPQGVAYDRLRRAGREAAGTRLRVRPPRLGAARPRRTVEAGALQQQVAQRLSGSCALCPPDAARSSSAKNGLPSERAAIASVSAAGSAWRAASSSAESSSRSSGARSSTRAEPERRTPSASRAVAGPIVVCAEVASSRTGWMSRWCARKTTRSSVEVSAQCRSSSTSSTGCGRGAPGEQRQRLLEHSQLRTGAVWPAARASRADAAPRRTAGRAARCRRDRSSGRGEPRTRRRGHAPRAPRQGGSCRCRHRRRPGRPRPPRPRRFQRALELPELTCAPDEHLARASLHFGQYRAACPRAGRAS